MHRWVLESFSHLFFPVVPVFPAVLVVQVVIPVTPIVLVVLGVIYQLHLCHHLIFMIAISTGKLPFYNLSPSWAALSVVIAQSGIWFWCSSSFLQTSQGKKDARDGNDFFVYWLFFGSYLWNLILQYEIWFIKGNMKMVNIDLLSCRWTGRPGMCNVSCFGLWCNSNPTTSESNSLVLNST